jgi:electron-transferring-flavoprotein dehydrogenase
VFEPRALDELFPDWKERGAPVHTAVRHDDVHFLSSATGSIKVPEFFIPRPMRNVGPGPGHSNYIISLGRLCQWLGQQAESLGANLFPGFAAADLLIEDGRVAGVLTGDMGRSAAGAEKAGFQAGYALRARYTVFAEGCRGHLGKQLMERFELRRDADPQHYGLGLKEVWTIDPAKHQEGLVVHTLGWPLASDTEGGGFLYHAADHQVFLGYIVALNYSNPHLSPFEEFQRWKQHPRIRQYLEGAKRVSYGARAVNKGGWQSLPRLTFPGGLLAGCDAGFLNGAKIKGSHTAMKTGMVAAETLFAALGEGDAAPAEPVAFTDAVRRSWVFDELWAARNFGPAQKKFGRLLGSAFIWLDQNLFGGRLPFTLRSREPDHLGLRSASAAPRIPYPRPDGVVSFDRLSSVFLSSTNHAEDQPCHLQLQDAAVPIRDNLPRFDEPAQRYCPAGVYEVVREGDGPPRFQINAQNCVHCKTCDIKDPAQNINWVAPEGGGGPNYAGM